MADRPDRQEQNLSASGGGMTFVSRKKRDRSWDREHNYQVASYRIDPEVKQRILDIADNLKVSTADLAEFFFRYAIDHYEKGELKIKREPKEYEIKAE